MADIHANGDVVFVVADENYQIRVSSIMLRNASPVFKVLLGPRFAEGQQLRNEGYAEVPLPEDDPDALTPILHVLRGRNDLVPGSGHRC